MTKPTASFHNFANEPKNEKYVTKSGKVVALTGYFIDVEIRLRKTKT